MSKAVVLVHGAWHGPSCWQPLVDALAGVDVRTVDLPSSGTDPAALGGLAEDAAEITRVLAGIDGPSIVVAHSYGGAPVTQAVEAGSGVEHIVYVSALQLDAGESLLGLTGGQVPPYWREHDGYVTVETAEQIFYDDLTPERTATALAGLRLQSRSSLEQPVTRAAWREVPSSYVVCSDDRSFPPQAQEMLAHRADTVHHVASGHFPFLRDPEGFAALLRPLL
ncbi:MULTISPECIES: alpha/beta hydrolase [Catenuloplanes]|uniref:Pimeloyl-ACP methyl ester carboxylesterase n=1 Tax=Catenuloplanes niger TaxID=587534 RepID=A0AAE3ZH60_9ACTN|nr:alpha/beta hydrolase [Catenuloplanes niger]MDR7319867.1 pimeloyl-ACP methyl ester carboxylesterase [Catenuloplanes niger]